VLTVIDKYVLKQISMPLLASLAIGLLVLLAERLVRLLDVTLGKKNSFGVVFEMLAYLVPHYLGTAVPAALFLGLLFGFNKLSKNHEVDGMMAAGIGLHRLLRPALLLALLFSVASLIIFGWVQPHTRYAYRSVLFDVKNVDAFYLAEEGVFMQSGSRTFILDELDRSNNAFKRIFVFDYNGHSIIRKAHHRAGPDTSNAAPQQRSSPDGGALADTAPEWQRRARQCGAIRADRHPVG
jgi:lipopolysaccharide export system permease protein